MATEKKATVHSRVTAQSRARSNNNNNKKTKSNSKPKLTVSPLKEGSLAARKARRAAPKKTSEEKADEVADDEEMHLHYSRHYELHCLNNPVSKQYLDIKPTRTALRSGTTPTDYADLSPPH